MWVRESTQIDWRPNVGLWHKALIKGLNADVCYGSSFEANTVEH